jgi:hypothetical protein
LTAGFVAAMALVLGGTGFYVFSQVRSDLNATIDADLGARLDGTRGLLAAAGADLEPTATRLRRKGGSFLQIVSESGRVVTVTPATRAPALLSASQLAAARRGEIRFESAHVPGVTGRARVLAAPVRTEEHRDVVVASD